MGTLYIMHLTTVE